MPYHTTGYTQANGIVMTTILMVERQLWSIFSFLYFLYLIFIVSLRGTVQAFQAFKIWKKNVPIWSCDFCVFCFYSYLPGTAAGPCSIMDGMLLFYRGTGL